MLLHVWKHSGKKRYRCSVCPYMARYGRHISMVEHVKHHVKEMKAQLIDDKEVMKEEIDKLAKVLFPNVYGNVRMP